MQDLEEMNLTELKKIAKENNIKNISKLKKDELITILKQVLHSTTKNKAPFDVWKDRSHITMLRDSS